MKKFWMGAVAAVLGLSAVAHAGAKFNTMTVYISTGYAMANFAAARSSADAVAEADCFTYAGHGGAREASCYFVDATGKTATCFTTEDALVGALSGLQDDSSVEVTWNDSGVCTSAESGIASAIAPKTP